MNVIEKILSAHSEEPHVRPGQIIDVSLDHVMANDVTTCLAIDVFENELKVKRVFDPDRVVLVMDHYTPSSSVDAADTHNRMRAFAREQGLSHVYDGVGICHQLMMENHVCPGELIVGADSHTCTYGALGALATGMGSTDVAVAWKEGKIWMKVPETIRIEARGEWPAGVYAKDFILQVIADLTARGATYKALLFTGPAIRALSIPGRMTLCNMVIEAGAKFGYVAPDVKTAAFMKAAGRDSFSVFSDDPDAEYARVMTYDVGCLTPRIAFPHSVDNVGEIGEFEGMAIDECFLGACTNGRYEDLAVAASILEGRKIADSLRLLVTPASREEYIRAIETGVITTLVESGAMVSAPGCSACFGGTGGILGKGEKLLSTANRNFKGRVGSPDSDIYLASPATVAVSALTGVITDPRRYMQ
jgi:3-isopropylmalate/(R)-2-methylmalate dehydratase large subunit